MISGIRELSEHIEVGGEYQILPHRTELISRHAMALPVRGQNTRTNAKTAKKMNRVDRRHFSTGSASSPILSAVARLRSL